MKKFITVLLLPALCVTIASCKRNNTPANQTSTTYETNSGDVKIRSLGELSVKVKSDISGDTAAPDNYVLSETFFDGDKLEKSTMSTSPVEYYVKEHRANIPKLTIRDGITISVGENELLGHISVKGTDGDMSFSTEYNTVSDLKHGGYIDLKLNKNAEYFVTFSVTRNGMGKYAEESQVYTCFVIIEVTDAELTNQTTALGTELAEPSAVIMSDKGTELTPFKEFACSYLCRDGYFTHADGRPMFMSGCAEVLDEIPSLEITDSFEFTSLVGNAPKYINVYDETGKLLSGYEKITPENIGEKLGAGEHIISFSVTNEVGEYYITNIFYVKLIIG